MFFLCCFHFLPFWGQPSKRRKEALCRDKHARLNCRQRFHNPMSNSTSTINIVLGWVYWIALNQYRVYWLWLGVNYINQYRIYWLCLCVNYIKLHWMIFSLFMPLWGHLDQAKPSKRRKEALWWDNFQFITIYINLQQFIHTYDNL